MVISKTQSEIIPNVTMSGPSRKGVRKLIAKKYSMRSSDRLSQLPTGFRHPSKEIVREFESLLPELNALMSLSMNDMRRWSSIMLKEFLSQHLGIQPN